MHKVVVGIFSNPVSAAHAVHECRVHGFSRQDVSVIPATDHETPLTPEVAEVSVMPSTARGFGVIPLVSALVGTIFGFLFWQVLPGSFGHFVTIGGPLGFLYGAAVGIVLESYFGATVSRYAERRRALENPVQMRTLVSIHTEELLETYEAERLLEINGAMEISTKAA